MCKRREEEEREGGRKETGMGGEMRGDKEERGEVVGRV